MRIVVGVCLLFTAAAVAGASAQTDKPESLDGRASYAIGLNVARQMAAQGIEIDVELLTRGLRDSISGSEPLLSEQELQSTMQELQQKVQQAMQAQMEALAEENQRAGAAFLTSNANREGVVTLASGLQYKVLTEGGGDKPAGTDTVRVHYEGRLLDDTIFDSSRQRGEPVEFAVQGVIRGWVEALQLMQVGSKWQLFIPSDLAYGPRGKGPQIGPNAVLIFEVELLEIVAPTSES